MANPDVIASRARWDRKKRAFVVLDKEGKTQLSPQNSVLEQPHDPGYCVESESMGWGKMRLSISWKAFVFANASDAALLDSHADVYKDLCVDS